jgi:hypothetical protein
MDFISNGGNGADLQCKRFPSFSATKTYPEIGNFPNCDWNDRAVSPPMMRSCRNVTLRSQHCVLRAVVVQFEFSSNWETTDTKSGFG